MQGQRTLGRAQARVATLLFLGGVLTLVAGTSGCTRTSAKANATSPSFAGPCAIALTAHQGQAPLDEQIRQVQQWIKQAPNPRPNLEQLGWKFVEKARQSYDPGFYKLAEQCAACLENYPPLSNEPVRLKNADALLLRGHILHNLHRFKEAETLARSLSAERGLSFDHALLGDVLLEQGRFDEAAVAYQKMMDLKPGLQAYLRAAQLRWLKGDSEGAIEMALRAVRAAAPQEPTDNAWALTRLAFYDLHAGLVPQADAACAAALRVAPQDAAALLLQGRVRLAQGQAAAAVASLQQAAQLNPLPEYQWTLAEALRAAQRPAEAAQVETALKAKGALEDPRTLALYLATRGEDLPQALRLAEAELAVRRDPHTLDALAWAQARAGRPTEAWATLQQALAAGTPDARLAFHAAVIAQQVNQPREAQRRFKQAQSQQAALLPDERTQLQQLRF